MQALPLDVKQSLTKIQNILDAEGILKKDERVMIRPNF